MMSRILRPKLGEPTGVASRTMTVAMPLPTVVLTSTVAPVPEVQVVPLAETSTR